MTNKPDVILLFSGGLDSILAARLLMTQGLKVTCLHLLSPFFGNADKVAHWRGIYGLDIVCDDVGSEFAAMLANVPPHGFGKTLNPCVDCKILQITRAAAWMRETGAAFIATGEVLGQRPMSQRGDMLNHIPKKAGLDGKILRPLCARLLEPTEAETSGLVDRSALLGISGRGRNGQLDLAREFGLAEIPTPAGGCRLTEKENSRRYWHTLKKHLAAGANIDLTALQQDLALANLGRHFIAGKEPESILCIGRNAADNAALLAARRDGDLTLKLARMPGPIALARNGAAWTEAQLRLAASWLASYSPRAMAAKTPVRVGIRPGDMLFDVLPQKPGSECELPDWETTRAEIRAFAAAARRQPS